MAMSDLVKIPGPDRLKVTHRSERLRDLEQSRSEDCITQDRTGEVAPCWIKNLVLHGHALHWALFQAAKISQRREHQT